MSRYSESLNLFCIVKKYNFMFYNEFFKSSKDITRLFDNCLAISINIVFFVKI